MAKVQWCNLPHEIWGKIISRIDVIDAASFTSSCKSLENVCKLLGVLVLKPGSALLLTSQPDQDALHKIEVELDLDTGKFGLHTICDALSFCHVNKGLQRTIWLGGKDGWLVTINPSLDMELLNLITVLKVPLPSIISKLQAIQVSAYTQLISSESPPYSRDIRRVVLSRTPSHVDGYEAIALFSDGLLTYMTQNINGWRVLKNPSYPDDNTYMYYPETFFDAIVYREHVLAIEDDGDLYAWGIRDPDSPPLHIPTPTHVPNPSEYARSFYLAITPSDNLILACLHGHGYGSVNKHSRMLWSVHDMFEVLENISLFEFDDAIGTWRSISTIWKDPSLILGLNYPFFATSTQLKGNIVYVADVRNYDVGICILDEEGKVYITVQDFPDDKKEHLLKAWTIFSPIWFRTSGHEIGLN